MMRFASHVASRFLEVWRARGLWGLLRFGATRLLSRREDLVFEINLAAPLPLPQWPSGGEVRLVDGNGLDDPAQSALLKQVMQGETRSHADGMREGDLLLAHVDEQGRVDCFGFVIFESHYKHFIGIAVRTPLIGNCNTAPDARGRGLYPALLLASCRILAERGHDCAVITCAPDNEASIRGITKAGFSRVAHRVTWIAFSRLVLARHTLAG